MLGYDLIGAFKQEAEDLRKDIDGLMNQMIDKNEGVLREVHPDLLGDYKKLKSSIKDQKDENEILYKQLLNLKKETASSAQKITLCANRINRLENNVGINQQFPQ